MFIGGIVLIPLIKIRGAVFDRSYIGGFCCGIALFFSIIFQQIGLVYTTAGKAAFITAIYVIIVPVLGLFMKKMISRIMWLCVILAVAGVYLLCMESDFFISKWDLLVLLSAFGYAAHIITVDHFAPKCDPVILSCMQFFVCGAICLPTMIIEAPLLSDLLDAWLPIVYVGVISCGVAYTFQIVAQRDTTPTITAVILSFESVFAVITGFFILNEILSIQQIIGCAVMFAAIIMAQIPEKPKGGII